MKKRVHQVDPLAEGTEELLSEVSSIERLVEDLPDQTIADIHSQMRRRAMNALDQVSGLRLDARFELRVSDDAMLCSASFYPPAEEGRFLESDAVIKELSREGVVYGVDYEALHNAVLRCNTERVEIRDIVLAEGAPAVPEISEHLLIEPHLLKRDSEIDLDALRIDHKERSPFVFVKKGDLLARRVARQTGEPGRDLRGKVVAAPPRHSATASPGENVIERDGMFYAEIDGRFATDGKSFSVSAVLVIPGNVDYSTGHIDFAGDVVVGGEILEGFKVKAAGSIFCAKTVTATEIECGKNLIVARGIIGREDGSVKVGGEIRCKYIEHCYVEARGPIRAFVGAMNSLINTLDSFETGPRGILVGGRIRAQNRVVAGQIGTEMGPPTEIYCGVDFTVLDRLEWIRDRNLGLANRLAEVRRRARALPTGDLSLMKLEERLHEAIKKMNNASIALVSHLDKNEEATVVAREWVHPNTYIEVCHASFVVARKTGRVAFRLDKAKGRVVPIAAG